MTKLRTLIVDDSPVRRQLLAEMLEGTQLAQVIGNARDGAEALQMATTLKPDLITLDLEMPRVNGLSFLRLLMSTRPTPVIVVSSLNQREHVFRALELGALDFIAVPEGKISDEARRTLANKLTSMRAVRREHISLGPPPPKLVSKTSLPPSGYQRPKFLVGIGASTGGPSALTRLLSSLGDDIDAAFLIAQHMPASFTTAFAQRLNRYSSLNVSEARDGDLVCAGTVFVCPGSTCMEVTDNGRLKVRLRPPGPGERYIPSANQLLTSVASAYGANAIGVVLTGMGDDGSEGAKSVVRGGGRMIIESEESCVVYGMPRAALKAVPECISAPLDEIPSTIERCCRN